MPKKYDRELLIRKIADMRIKSASTLNILNYLQDDVGMCKSVAYDILQDAQKYIIEITDDDFEASYREAVQQIEQQMDNCKYKKDWIALRQELNKLKGLHKAQRVDVTTKGQSLNEIVVTIVNSSDKLNDNE